ncbi:MAG: DNA topoisomerase III [Betaproteobacteria bacterium TMED156]|nr:MAG: DNA topoisomerase III [Betaproteobacteria bacterium TMED156]
MGKKLVIAEKPSVASDIAKALGGFKKNKDIYENEEMVIVSAVGHLLRLSVPSKYDVTKGKWTFEKLPHIPPKFTLDPDPKTEAKLKTVLRQTKRKDICTIINACDSGREGELIFRNIIAHSKSKLPIKRLWLQSMTADSIRDGFSKLKSNEELIPLSNAAKCRAEADWLIGINGTRAMTAFNNKKGGFYKTTVGRVQTPTLALVVERDTKIKKFVSKEYFELVAEFKVKNGIYKAKWFDPNFKKDDNNLENREDRIWDRQTAEKIRLYISDKTGSIIENIKNSSQSSPLLFDLTSLQREANSRFGFSAKNTLGLAQALYDKHKLLTYPRTDSKALPEDYVETVKQTIENLKGISNYSFFCRKALENGVSAANKKLFNNSKISDHFAIIPTGTIPKTLSDPEKKLFDMVVKRFLANFFPPAQFLNTKRITIIESNHFKTEGKIISKAGWLEIYSKFDEDKKNSLVKITKNEIASLKNISIRDDKTKPPPRYSEASLLSAMETAGKLVANEDQRDAMLGKGLGTAATRSTIIESLIKEKYLIRDGRELISTANATQLMRLLKGLNVKELSLPSLTGEWEFKLKEIEDGKRDAKTFMSEIVDSTSRIVNQAKSFDSDNIPGDYETLKQPCPKCKKTVKETYKTYSCVDQKTCLFSIKKINGNRVLAVTEAEELLKNKSFGPVDGYRSRRGFPFAATIILNEEFELKFDFESTDESEDTVDFSNALKLGECPKCSSGVYIYKTSYICEKNVGVDKKCNFRSGLMILQQPISSEQMVKLLKEKKTDLLNGFVSARTKRKFSAYLVVNGGKVSFEFASKTKK